MEEIVRSMASKIRAPNSDRPLEIVSRGVVCTAPRFSRTVLGLLTLERFRPFSFVHTYLLVLIRYIQTEMLLK